MMHKLYLLLILALIVASCQNNKKNEQADHGHSHEDVKQILTTYSNEFELFAEADPFIVGETAHIAAHFSHIPDFSPLENAEIILKLRIAGNEIEQKAAVAGQLIEYRAL